jgi:hypothetical protein
MYRFARETPALSAEDLAELRERLRKMRDDELVKFYNQGLHLCQLNRGGQPPRAGFVKLLAQAWKELDRRRKLAAK